MYWKLLEEKSRKGKSITREEAQSVLHCSEREFFSMFDSAFRVRKAYFGRNVKLNYLLNVKSGLCAEDCSYCSQSKVSRADVEKYPFLSEKDILSSAGRAVALCAGRLCIVSSGRKPAQGEIDSAAGAVRKIKEQYPGLEVCLCLGLLEPEQAKKLKDSGLDVYNHNLNTSKEFYPRVCTTHTWQDRLKTLETIKHAGIYSCSGCLFGMGETDDDILDIAFALRKEHPGSIPINFLIPIKGTPLEDHNSLTPQKCLRILALFRFLNPKSEIRIAGGREYHLRWLQPLGLYAANSIFIGDYLTTKGQKPEEDIAMIRDLGFEIERHEGVSRDSGIIEHGRFPAHIKQ